MLSLYRLRLGMELPLTRACLILSLSGTTAAADAGLVWAGWGAVVMREVVAEVELDE